MLLSQIKPFVRQALRANFKENDETDIKQFSVDSRLFYITSGNGKITVKDTVYEVSPGNVIIFRAATKYIWTTDNIECYIVNFDFTQSHAHVKQTFHPIRAELYRESDIIDIVSFDDEPLLNEPIVVSGSDFKELAKMIFLEYTMGGENSEAILSSLMTAMILKILHTKKSAVHEESKADALSRKIISYISANYSRPIQVSDIAEWAHYNPVYINRLFKKSTGHTVHEYLCEYRLNVSAELLATLNVTVIEIAAMCGFCNLHYFSRCFKKRFGLSPTQWKSKNNMR